MPDVFTIRTGTRDELAGVDIGFVNVFERDDRPGQLSVQLVLPDRNVIVAVGDAVEVGGEQFRLLALTADEGAYLVQIEQVAQGAPPPPSVLPIPPVQAADLGRVLRGLTPTILRHLSGGAPVPDLLEWQTESRQTTHREWNGGEIGPNTSVRGSACFGPSQGVRVESSVTLDDLRYHPSEIYRREISAFWRIGEASAHIFLRAEGDVKFDHITGDTLDPAILTLLRQAIVEAGN